VVLLLWLARRPLQNHRAGDLAGQCRPGGHSGSRGGHRRHHHRGRQVRRGDPDGRSACSTSTEYSSRWDTSRHGHDIQVLMTTLGRAWKACLHRSLVQGSRALFVPHTVGA
jgi:hypothetical protein